MKPTTYLLVLLACSALSACAPFRPTSSHAGMCNELNSKMIFDGGTANIRQDEIEESEEPLVQRNYDKSCGS